ncbi:MAG: glycosyltransferase family 2 protein [Vulcanimicrobiota bacterium]
MPNPFTFLRKPPCVIALGLAFSFTILFWLMPKVALVLTAGMAFLTLLLVGSRLICTFMRNQIPEQIAPGEEFVSIHIATYSEPPQVVKETLDSLTNLAHPNYEVIVLDNNTPDPEMYEPVKEHCRKLGPKFRFYHFDGVRGAKAGALNISLNLSDPRTDVILILDADYQALPDILNKGLSYFTDSSVALVQFPQAYRNSRPNCGLSWEYKLFFDLYMKLANRWNTVLSTGTAAFVQKDALVASGGWSGETLTEDAELGLRLHKHDYRAVYVPEVVAAGLMPTDLKSLRAQRRRWVLGNAQSLLALWKLPEVSRVRRTMMTLQLTAWANPLLFPTVTLLVSGSFYLAVGSPPALAITILSFATIGLYLVGSLLLFARVVQREGGSLKSALLAFGVHLGMLWEGAVSWCELFVQSDKSFVRTNKFIRATESWSLSLSLILALLFGGFSLQLALSGTALPLALALGMGSLWCFGTSVLRWSVHRVRARTLRMGKRKQVGIPAIESMGYPEPIPRELSLHSQVG